MLLISLCTLLVLTILSIGNYTQITFRSEPLGFDNDLRLVVGRGILICFAIVLILTSTVRYGFIDTFAYKIMYNSVRNNLTYVYSKPWGVEAAWLYFLYILNFISTDPKFMLFICALIINAAYTLIISKNSADVCFSLLLYFSLGYMGTNNGLRQCFAAAITLLAFPLLQKKKYLIYLLFALLASLFHESAVVCVLICMVVSGKPLNLKTIFALCFGVCFLFFPRLIMNYISDIFEENKYVSYLEFTKGMGFLRALVAGIIPGILAILYIVRCRRSGIEIAYGESVLLNTLLINTMFVLMGLYMQYWARFGFYTSFASIILMPKLIHEISGRKQYRSVKAVALVCYMFFFGYNIFVNIGYGAMDSFYIDIP